MSEKLEALNNKPRPATGLLSRILSRRRHPNTGDTFDTTLLDVSKKKSFSRRSVLKILGMFGVATSSGLTSQLIHDFLWTTARPISKQDEMLDLDGYVSKDTLSKAELLQTALPRIEVLKKELEEIGLEDFEEKMEYVKSILYKVLPS